jgi:hypothetical protein
MITRRRESGLKGKITKGRVSENFLNGVEFWEKKNKKEKIERRKRKQSSEGYKKEFNFDFVVSSFDVFSPFP